MTPILPMLAQELTAKIQIVPNRYVAERKYDGHRHVVRITAARTLEAWSRTGKDALDKMDSQLREQCISKLPPGVYDGELILPGGRSYDVTMLENHHKLHYVVFDLLEDSSGASTMQYGFAVRRAALEGMKPFAGSRVHLSDIVQVDSRAEIETLVEELWKSGEEGVVVKDLLAKYAPGKRPKAFFKLKEFQTCEVTLIGFEPGQGEVIDRGVYAVLVCRDDEGHTVKMKSRDDAMLAEFQRADSSPAKPESHPYIGRRIEIGFHQRTDDGNYRHPRIVNWRAAE